MLEHLKISNILFFDIETVCAYPKFTENPPPLQELWKKKARSILRKYDEDLTEEEIADTYTNRAAIYAEFGKIVCISVGLIHRDEAGTLSLRLKSFANKDEQVLLEEFSKLMNQYYNNPTLHYLCGHNIREFDVPYICRRLVVNQLPLPELFNLPGKKPWETKYLLDTMELWKFGDYKSYTSLNLLSAILDFPTPKGDMDGSKVGLAFWQEDDLPKIARYCEKDVEATVNLLFRYMRIPILEEHQVIHVDDQTT